MYMACMHIKLYFKLHFIISTMIFFHIVKNSNLLYRGVSSKKGYLRRCANVYVLKLIHDDDLVTTSIYCYDASRDIDKLAGN